MEKARAILLQRWTGEIPIYAGAAMLLAACAALLASQGVALSLAPILANANLFALSILAIAVLLAVAELARSRPREPIAHLRSMLSDHRIQIAGGLPLLGLLVLLMPFFSQMKAAIPLFNTYSWDADFIAWDRAIFGGRDAWEILQPVLGYPVITALLGLLYQMWFLLLFIGTLWFAFARRAAPVRRQFFLTYVLAWTIVGGAMATWLASVGPCFLEPLVGDATFAAQMDYLREANEQVPVMPLQVQQMLLDWHMADAGGLGSGITAMPSMHVAICVLFWLAMRRVSRRLAAVFLAFLVAIWIGSVHLAYHYAVDGLVSLIAIIALWKLSEALLAGWDSWLARTRQAALRTNTVPAE
ncbi:MAG: phosphatase PAP2 family protein [Alteripontixanthobacter sp.]